VSGHSRDPVRFTYNLQTFLLKKVKCLNAPPLFSKADSSSITLEFSHITTAERNEGTDPQLRHSFLQIWE